MHHKYCKNGVVEDIPFGLDEESEGTQKLFFLSGPVMDTLRQGKTLVIVEIEARMHTLLTRKIIGLFNSEKTNPNHAQLNFATHDTNFFCQKSFSAVTKSGFFLKKMNLERAAYILLQSWKSGMIGITRKIIYWADMGVCPFLAKCGKRWLILGRRMIMARNKPPQFAPRQRKKNYMNRAVNVIKVRQRFLIVCEGAKTEPQYFEQFHVPALVSTGRRYRYEYTQSG
jgi:hypothetical protein